MTQSLKKVLIAGGSGLVGQRLTQLLVEQNYQVNILTRSSSRTSALKNVHYFKWDIAAEKIEDAATDVDFVINLAGAGIADKRWTAARKKEILESRTLSTQFLAKTIKQSGNQIKQYIGASAIGIYGDSKEQQLTEDKTSSSSDFMVQVCQQWEEAHQSLSNLVNEVSMLRIGIVLSTKGGALKEILKPLQMGRIATYFGDGSMIYSWIHIDDLCNMFIQLLNNKIPSGIYNAVSPEPISNKKLVETIMHTRSLTALKMPAPSFLMKLMLGEMSNTILNSTSVSSALIQKEGYKFDFPQLEMALEDLFEGNK